jgi:hypothetical protein
MPPRPLEHIRWADDFHEQARAATVTTRLEEALHAAQSARPDDDNRPPTEQRYREGHVWDHLLDLRRHAQVQPATAAPTFDPRCTHVCVSKARSTPPSSASEQGLLTGASSTAITHGTPGGHTRAAMYLRLLGHWGTIHANDQAGWRGASLVDAAPLGRAACFLTIVCETLQHQSAQGRTTVRTHDNQIRCQVSACLITPQAGESADASARTCQPGKRPHERACSACSPPSRPSSPGPRICAQPEAPALQPRQVLCGAKTSATDTSASARGGIRHV